MFVKILIKSDEIRPKITLLRQNLQLWTNYPFCDVSIIKFDPIYLEVHQSFY